MRKTITKAENEQEITEKWIEIQLQRIAVTAKSDQAKVAALKGIMDLKGWDKGQANTNVTIKQFYNDITDNVFDRPQQISGPTELHANGEAKVYHRPSEEV